MWFGRVRRDVGGVSSLERGDSVKNPLSDTTSEARGVVLPGFGRGFFGYRPLSIDIPGIILLKDWGKIVRQDDAIKCRDERSRRRVVAGST